MVPSGPEQGPAPPGLASLDLLSAPPVAFFVWKALRADRTGFVSAICNRKRQHRTACLLLG